MDAADTACFGVPPPRQNHTQVKTVRPRDIRPKNIFLTSNGNIKLGSFKSSKLLEDQVAYASTLINSAYYMTPELLEGKQYDCKVDLWAFGCVLYEVCWLKPLKTAVNLA